MKKRTALTLGMLLLAGVLVQALYRSDAVAQDEARFTGDVPQPYYSVGTPLPIKVIVTSRTWTDTGGSGGWQYEYAFEGGKPISISEENLGKILRRRETD